MTLFITKPTCDMQQQRFHILHKMYSLHLIKTRLTRLLIRFLSYRY